MPRKIHTTCLAPTSFFGRGIKKTELLADIYWFKIYTLIRIFLYAPVTTLTNQLNLQSFVIMRIKRSGLGGGGGGGGGCLKIYFICEGGYI